MPRRTPLFHGTPAATASARAGADPGRYGRRPRDFRPLRRASGAQPAAVDRGHAAAPRPTYKIDLADLAGDGGAEDTARLQAVLKDPMFADIDLPSLETATLRQLSGDDRGVPAALHGLPGRPAGPGRPGAGGRRRGRLASGKPSQRSGRRGPAVSGRAAQQFPQSRRRGGAARPDAGRAGLVIDGFKPATTCRSVVCPPR